MWQRLDYGSRLGLPLFSAVVCVLLGAMVWPLPYLGTVAPPLALMAVYYWSIHRPDLFRPGMAFLIGLLNDILHDLPLGLSGLLYVAAHQVALSQRRYVVGHSFFMLWSGFILILLGVTLLQWLMMDLLKWQIFPLIPIGIHMAIAIALFPLPCWLFIALQRLTPSLET